MYRFHPPLPQMELAVCAWRAVLAGRFRLLERWCAFAGGSGMRVVSEDTWRQVGAEGARAVPCQACAAPPAPPAEPPCTIRGP